MSYRVTVKGNGMAWGYSQGYRPWVFSTTASGTRTLQSRSFARDLSIRIHDKLGGSDIPGPSVAQLAVNLCNVLNMRMERHDVWFFYR